MGNEFDWTVPPLSPEDQRVVDVYKEVGRPFEDLPYTDEFDHLCQRLGVGPSNEERHRLYKRLYDLKYSGRLPRVAMRRFVGSGHLSLPAVSVGGTGTVTPASKRPDDPQG